VIAWLLGTSLGRGVATALAAVVVVAGALAAAFQRGKAAQKQQQVADTLQNAQTRDKVDDAIARRTADDRRNGLAEWVRHE
jgi:hypothetical protein